MRVWTWCWVFEVSVQKKFDCYPPVFGAAEVAPRAAAGVASAAVVVFEGFVDVVAVACEACESAAFCFLREKRPLRPFLTCAIASGAMFGERSSVRSSFKDKIDGMQ